MVQDAPEGVARDFEYGRSGCIVALRGRSTAGRDWADLAGNQQNLEPFTISPLDTCIANDDRLRSD